MYVYLIILPNYAYSITTHVRKMTILDIGRKQK